MQVVSERFTESVTAVDAKEARAVLWARRSIPLPPLPLLLPLKPWLLLMPFFHDGVTANTHTHSVLVPDVASSCHSLEQADRRAA